MIGVQNAAATGRRRGNIAMNTLGTHMTVADYCQAMDRGEIVVNLDYQRSDKVWPPAARSYLIETIILGFPVPKLSLHQITDLRSRKSVKEIVDGQQRSRAIHDFFKDKFTLTTSLETEDIAGKTYSELDPEYQKKFLDFSISLDLFVSATREDVIEVFRRMNSYTIPLNPEEQRHASFQGAFKWFIDRLAKKFDNSFLEMGLFGQKQLVRMADTKLLAEVCDAFLRGIRTTDKKILHALYRDHDNQFPEEADLKRRITEAFDTLREWRGIHNGELMKPYIVYALVLAIAHLRRPVAAFREHFPSPRIGQFDNNHVEANLSVLSEALEDPENSPGYAEFVGACTSKTNVKDQRIKRFQWMCKALTADSL
jgi:Protein of unknown function DUF262